jgi:4-amino-4-deoxy-L-arabinose transferase-like glycosyltransferase
MPGALRGWWARVLAVWAGAVVLRVGFVMLRTRHDEPLGDQIYYSAQALANARGNWFEQPFAPGMPAADHPPLTSLVLTPITWLTESTGSFITAQRLQTAVLGSIAVILMALLGRALVGERVGLVAASLTAVYANVWINDGLVMSESLAFLLTAAITLLVVHWWRRPSVSVAVGVGALAGLAALTRPELLLLVPVAGVVVPLVAPWCSQVGWRRALAMAGLAVAAAGVVVGPWVLWNQARFDGPALLSTNDGLTIAGANCDTTYFGRDLGGWDIWCAYAVPRPDGLDAAQESEIMRRAGLDYWRDHLDRYPVVAVARVARVLSIGWVPQTVEAGRSEGRPATLSWLGIVQWWLLVPLAAVGWRQISEWRHRLALVVLLPAVVLVAMVANAYVRFRVPAEVGVLVLAATGIVAIAGRRRE